MFAHRYLSKVRGFTLVELLVVIGIIALLISILLPSLAKARQAANTTACLASLNQMGQALHMYANDNRNYMPYLWFQNHTTATPGTLQTRYWHHFLSVYMGKKEAVSSPLPVGSNGGQISPAIDFGCKEFASIRTANDPTSGSYQTGYGMPYHMNYGREPIFGVPGYIPNNRPWYTGTRFGSTGVGFIPLKMNRLEYKDRQWVIGDSLSFYISPTLFTADGVHHGSSPDLWYWYNYSSTSSANSVSLSTRNNWADPQRHSKKFANYLFVDGHAESLSPREAFRAYIPNLN